jgi:hypothetical protein
MSYITEIIANASDEYLLEKIIKECGKGEHWFLRDEENPQIQRIEHFGNKKGHHFHFSCSCNGFFNIEELQKSLKAKIKCDYLEWVRLDIIPEGNFIFSWYNRNF